MEIFGNKATDKKKKKINVQNIQSWHSKSNKETTGSKHGRKT